MRRAVVNGLRLLRKEIKDDRSFEVLIYSAANEQEPNFLSDGTVIGPNAIVINHNLKKFARFPERTRLCDLEGTIVHEAVHALRFKHKMTTIRHALLNEGISCFVQTQLTRRPPAYLDFGETRVKDIEKWWGWWNKKYFSESINRPFWSSAPGREGSYRIGYHIVSSYFDAHSALTLAQLINVRFRTLELFARKLFSK